MAELIDQGGLTLVAILSLSVAAWALIAWKWLDVRAQMPGSLRWADEALAQVRGGLVEEARRRCGGRRDVTARMMAEALATHEPQRRDFEVHLAPQMEAEQARLASRLDLIALIAAVCPLLGLLGTVLGMIVTFEAITSGGALEIETMARGISRALITTQAGLAVALPILLAHGYLRSRVNRCIELTRLYVKKIETIVCED